MIGSLKFYRLRFFGILGILLVWLQLPCYAAIDIYKSFKIPLKPEMTRLQVQEVFGDPKFMLYKNFYIKGFSSFIELCIVGYRVANKAHGLADFVTIVFTDDVQLATTILYHENEKNKGLKQIEKNLEIVSTPLNSKQVHFDKENRLMYFFNNNFLETGNAYQRFIASLGRLTKEDIIQLLGLDNTPKRSLNTVEDKIISITSVDLYATSAMFLGKNPYDGYRNP